MLVQSCRKESILRSLGAKANTKTSQTVKRCIKTTYNRIKDVQIIYQNMVIHSNYTSYIYRMLNLLTASNSVSVGIPKLLAFVSLLPPGSEPIIR